MTIAEPNAAPEFAEFPIDQAPIVADGRGDSFVPGGSANGAPADPSAGGTPTLLVEDPSVIEGGEVSDRGRVDGLLPPFPFPFPFPTRLSSGRYRSPGGSGFQLELRVDVDGRRPLDKVSGDYYATSGAATSYFGSWTVDAVTVTVGAAAVTIVGTARTTWSTTFTVATVTIPRRTVLQPPAPATIRWSTSSGQTGATYLCGWESAAFRTVELEQDNEAGVAPFAAYDTGSLPSGGPARTLTVASAYAEAGVQMLDTGQSNTINTPAGHIWDNASLHHAMERNFSRWGDIPQFKVWSLHANAHVLGPGLRGIMFDQQGRQRQGCASFYQVISAPTPPNLREQLYVNAHELGHCFNLYHSFHKAYMNPPLPNRPGSLSWMNYPSNYAPGEGAPSGAAAFWAAFPFQFDSLELAHLRHGFRDAVIMGGNPFGAGAAFDAGAGFGDVVTETAGVDLRISTDAGAVLQGLPVVVRIDLTTQRAQPVHRGDQLHPKYGFVQIAVTRPRGDTVIHEPPIKHCADPDLVRAEAGAQHVVSAYIGHDARAGQLFDDPGVYRIRAAYTTVDGTTIVSNPIRVRITPARTANEEEITDLMLSDEVGMVLTLLGSDSTFLSGGTTALNEVLERFPDHQAASFARLALGMNVARQFTQVHSDGTVSVRPPDLAQADSLLQPVLDRPAAEPTGLDDLTIYQVLDHLADAHLTEGDSEGAQDLRRQGARLARSNDAPAEVINRFLD